MLTVQELVNGFLNLQAKKYNPEQEESYRFVLGEFAKKFGDFAAEEVDRDMVMSWIDKRRSWKAANTKKSVYGRLGRLFSWGVEHDHLKVNPLRLTRKNPMPWEPDASSGHRAVSDEDFQKVLKVCNPRFARLLRFLRLTAVTPLELRMLKWDMVDAFAQTITVPNAGPGARPTESRKIPLSPEVESLLREIRKTDKHNDGKGYVFTTRSGRAWTRQDLSGGFRRYCDMAGIPGLSLFGVGRLSFYEKGLKKGLSPAEIAYFAGLKNPDVIVNRAKKHFKNDTDSLDELNRRFLSAQSDD